MPEQPSTGKLDGKLVLEYCQGCVANAHWVFAFNGLLFRWNCRSQDPEHPSSPSELRQMVNQGGKCPTKITRKSP